MGRARSSLSGPCGRHLLVVFLLVSSSSTASSQNASPIRGTSRHEDNRTVSGNPTPDVLQDEVKNLSEG